MDLRSAGDLQSRVAAIVGQAALLDPGGYAVDGWAPGVVARPADREQVSRLLALALATGARVIPWGGGTAIERGLPPEGVELVIVLDRLNRIVEHEPADLTVTVEAGLTLAALQSALAGKSQNLGLDAPLADRATIGGILAANLSGSRRLAFGTARDLTLGLTVAQPSGVITKSGGKVVKNVAGFDLNKLYIGSQGTLAVIVEATFKIAPLPRPRATLLIPLADPASLPDLVLRLRAANLPLRALDALIFGPGLRLTDVEASGAAALIAIDLAGTPAALDRQVRDLSDLVTVAGTADAGIGGPRRIDDLDRQTRFWQSVQDLGRAGSAADLIVRLGYRPHLFGDVLERVRSAFAGRLPGAVARAGSGVLTLFWASAEDPDPAGRIDRLRDALRPLAGVAVVERCPVELKRSVDAWGPVGPEHRLMRAIKQQFDPARILSPGRFVGGL